MNAAADPREIGELLSTYLSIKMDQVDAAVAEADAKVAAIPDLRILRERMGEWMLLTWVAEHEVKELKAEVERLKSERST